MEILLDILPIYSQFCASSLAADAKETWAWGCGGFKSKSPLRELGCLR